MIALRADGNIRDADAGVLREREEKLRARNSGSVDAGGRQKTGERVRDLSVEVGGPRGHRHAGQNISRYDVDVAQSDGKTVGDVADVRGIGQKSSAKLALKSE